MASAEQLIFDIIARANTEGFDKAGKAAQAAAGNVDTLTRRLGEVARKSATARVELAGNKEALAALDKVDARLISLGRRTANPNLKVEGAARAIAEISALDVELGKVGGKGGSAETAAASMTTLSGPSGMGAMIGAAVVLSPVVATITAGLAGYGLAAAGALAPIENAAKKTGGLSANMKLLNPEQQKVATGLLGLGAQFHKFEGQLQPEVLKTFATGLHIAGGLLHSIQPVALAAGKSLNGMLAGVDRGLASGEAHQFFTWLAQNAGPDLQLVASDFGNLAKAIPPVLEGLHPLSAFLLTTIGKTEQLTGDIAVMTSRLATLNHLVPKQGAGDSNPLKWLSDQNVIHGAKFLNDLLPRFLQHAAEGAGLVGKMGGKAQAAGPQMAGFGVSVYTTGQHAGTAAAHLQTMAQAVNALNTAQGNALSSQLAYSGDLIANANNAKAFRIALHASAGQVGLHTQKERDSFGTANTYIAGLQATAKQSWASGKGTKGAADAIRNALPLLDSAKTKNRLYWQEVRTLKQWLDKLNAEKAIHDVVHLSGSGAWTFGLSGTGSFPSRNIKGRAAGWRVPGHGSADTVPAMLTPGEAVVPRHLVPAVAPFLRANKVPGFASGGLVPSYAGSAAGLKPWGQHNFNATIMAMTAAFAAAGKAQQSLGGITSGALGGDEAANQRLARSLFPWSASQWPLYVALEMREAGFNRFARNQSSGAYGIPQALPPTKMPFAAQAAGGSHAGPQLGWQFGYIGQRYGSPAAAWAHEQAFNWYDDPAGSWMPPGKSLAYNGTGKAEHLTPDSGMVPLLGDIAAALDEVIGLLRAAPHHTGRALGDALNGVARSSAYSSMYGSR